MATKFFFDNKIIKLPGAYSTIVSGEQSKPLQLDYGKVLVIDTGVVGSNWGGGSGINGEQSSGKNSIYKFTDLSNYQSFLKGGLFFKIAEALFKPDKLSGSLGVSTVYHAKAATTTKATMTFTAVGGGSNGGVFKINPIDEGVIANGVTTNDHLDKGYGFKVRVSENDNSKWVIDFYVGSYVGEHTDGIPYNEIYKEDAEEILLVSSPEFNNIQTLIDWANSSSKFGRFFNFDSTSIVSGDGSVDSADITNNSGWQLAIGGTESYNLNDLNDLLDSVVDEDFSFILIDRYGMTDYKSTYVDAVKTFIINDSKFKHFLYIGGGKDENEFDVVDGSLNMGQYFNSSYIHVVHGEVGTASDIVSSGFRFWDTLYTAALVLGRTAGKQPQVPLTNKSIGIDKLKHNLTKKQQEKALDAGVKTIVYNSYLLKFVILQDINTLQDNERLFTPQGKSHQGSFMRIVEQINKELVVNAEIDLLSDENGVNANTLNKGDIVNFTETYLENRLAKPDLDNLILEYRDVVATREIDVWKVSYEIVVNNEINKIFFTGFLFS